MGTSVTKAFLMVSILVLVATGCAGSGPVRVPGSRSVSEIKTTPPQPPGQEEGTQDGEVFGALEEKMDEYQNLMAACERLTRTEENKTLRESCAMRLKALRQELFDLTEQLQVKPR